MTSNTTAEERHQAQQLFNDLIKKSDYLNSMLNSLRLATAQSFTIVMKALIKHDPNLAPVILDAIAQIEAKTFKSPSVDGDRSLIARSMREELKL